MSTGLAFEALDHDFLRCISQAVKKRNGALNSHLNRETLDC
jgi:hypothetical protein